MGTIAYVEGFDDWRCSSIETAAVEGWDLSTWMTPGNVPGRVEGQALYLNNSYAYRTVQADVEYSIAFAFNIAMTSIVATVLIQLQEGVVIHGSLRYNGNGTFSILRGTTVIATSAFVGLTADVWYHGEFDYKVHDSAGEYEFRLNEATIIGRTTGADTRNAGTAGVIDTVALEDNGSGTVIYFDDVVITKGSGFHGDCRVITDSVDADGASAAWSVGGTPRVVSGGILVEGTGAITVPWPEHEPGDIGLLFVETAGGEPISIATPPTGWTQVTNSPQSTGAGTAGTQLTVFWCRATSAWMESVVFNDAGDHHVAAMAIIRGCVPSGNPFSVASGGVKGTTSTAFSATGVTTTANNSLVVILASGDLDRVGSNFSAVTNANLTGLTTLFSDGSTSGNGGQLMLSHGVMATAGATGATTATHPVSAIDAFITLGFPPVTADWQAVPFNDADASYIASATPGDRDTFGFPDLGATGTVKAVAIAHVSRKDDAGNRLVATVVRRGGTNYDNASTQTLGTDYASQQQVYELDPSTSAAWTVANIDGAEFGIKLDT